MFFVVPLICLYGDPLPAQISGQAKDHHFPSLMQSIQFKNDIEYCNIKIPLDRQEVKERLEKEEQAYLDELLPEACAVVKEACKR